MSAGGKWTLGRVMIKCREMRVRALDAWERTGLSDPTGEMTRVVSGAAVRSEAVSDGGRVWVIVPFRNRWDMTVLCLESLGRQVIDGEVRVVLVDHESNAATREAVDRYVVEMGDRARVVRFQGAFNFSAMNNLAAREAEVAGWAAADWVLLLNNDVVMPRRDCLARMLSVGRAKGAGAVGATLVYPDGRLQHLMAAPGVKIVAAHPLRGEVPDWGWEWFREARPVPAATGAMLMVRGEAWRRVGGLDEALPTLGQDIDLCLRLWEQGWTTWVATDVVAEHHEGASRRAVFPRGEVERFFERWETMIERGHPLWGREFSRWSERPVRRRGEGPYPWWRVV